jgi:preprotein translocase SecE subunit
MTMAVVEHAVPERMPGSPQHFQLGVSSLFGAALVLFGIAFLLGGLPTIWDQLVAPAIDEFLSGALLLMVILAGAAGIGYGLYSVDRAFSQPGLRAGVFMGAVAYYLILGLITKIGWLMDTGEEAIGMLIALMVFTALVFGGVLWIFTRPGFGRWLIRIEEQGWFHAVSYKGNQGVRVRRGTIFALLTVGVCGIITLVTSGTLGSGLLTANDWLWEFPLTTNEDGELRYLPILHKVHITMPILLGLATIWVSWRVVNWPVFADFLIATEAEMNKVSWTTRRRLVQDTIVVLVTVFLFTAFLFVVDIIWIKVLTQPWIGVLQVDIREAFQKQQEKTQW